MGFSIMTIIEWFEMFFFLIMGIPVFLTAGKLNIFWMFVRKEDDGGTSVTFVTDLYESFFLSQMCRLIAFYR
jgi:hypothetical protein